MRTKDHKIICVNSVVHKSPASHAATVCVCVCVCSGVLIFVQFWDSEEGFHLWVAECRASVDAGSLQDKQSVSLWLVSQDLPFCVFKITYPFSPLCPGILGRGKLRDFFLNSSGKAVEGCFLYLENQTSSWGLHCCGCHFFNCFFFFTIFTCKKFPVSAKKVQLFSPASLLSGKTLNYWLKVVWSFS